MHLSCAILLNLRIYCVFVCRICVCVSVSHLEHYFGVAFACELYSFSATQIFGRIVHIGNPSSRILTRTHCHRCFDGMQTLLSHLVEILSIYMCEFQNHCRLSIISHLHKRCRGIGLLLCGGNSLIYLINAKDAKPSRVNRHNQFH